jgi:hypothetical protein
MQPTYDVDVGARRSVQTALRLVTTFRSRHVLMRIGSWNAASARVYFLPSMWRSPVARRRHRQSPLAVHPCKVINGAQA